VNLEELDVTVDGVAVLDEVHAAYTRYVIFPSPEAADAVTLYTAATHAQTAWEHASRLVIKSPIKRCGKTRLQEVARELVHKALPTTNISPAALARSISEYDPPTLILDEADTVWGKKEQRSEGAEDLRGILNSGHSRGWPYVRWDATARRAESCPTFAMAIIGGIGDMPDTIEDRAVVISMRRRGPGESVTQWRSRRAIPKLKALHTRLHDWVDAHRAELAEAEPDLPAEDRAADVWEPLVAIADAAGGDWPARARKACQSLTDSRPDPDTAGERLLADLYDVFGDDDQVFTTALIDRLCAIEEAPWSTWHRGERMTPRGMATLLRPWGIQSGNVRLPEGQAKGYTRADLADAWERYVLAARAFPSRPSQRPTGDESAGDGRDGSGTEGGPAIRPAAEQQLFGRWDGGTDGTEECPDDALQCDARGCKEPARDCGDGTYCRRHAKMLDAAWPGDATTEAAPGTIAQQFVSADPG
jgi:hypothetical protein